MNEPRWPGNVRRVYVVSGKAAGRFVTVKLSEDFATHTYIIPGAGSYSLRAGLGGGMVGGRPALMVLMPVDDKRSALTALVEEHRKALYMLDAAWDEAAHDPKVKALWEVLANDRIQNEDLENEGEK